MAAADAPETPAAAATRARCREVIVTIGNADTYLGAVVLPSGQLNSMQDASPPTPTGGYVLIAIEAIHGPTCAAIVAAGLCDCGAQKLLERMILA